MRPYEEKSRKPILCVDFDGVIHGYQSGWRGACAIPDPPVPGAIEWLRRATERWNVCVYSSRSKELGGIEAMQRWFRGHGAEDLLTVLSFPTQKPSAFLTIDDRAVCFDGDWGALDPVALLGFRPWNKRPSVSGGTES